MAEIKQVPVEIGKSYGCVDLVVVLDTTGSMSEIIEAVKISIANRLIGEIKNQMAKNQTKLDWRGRVIGFGDLKIGDRISEYPFTNQESDLVAQVRNLPRTRGAGDDPESALDALMMASRSLWRTGPIHMVVVLITDEPTFPQMESTTVPGGPRDVNHLIEFMTGTRIKLFLYGQQCDTFVQLKRIPKASIALWPESEIYTALPGLDFAKEFEIMAKTISAEAMHIIGAPLPSKTA
jgi:hypothetical protein